MNNHLNDEHGKQAWDKALHSGKEVIPMRQYYTELLLLERIDLYLDDGESYEDAEAYALQDVENRITGR